MRLSLVLCLMTALAVVACVPVYVPETPNNAKEEVLSVRRFLVNGEFYCTAWHLRGDLWGTAGHCVVGATPEDVLAVELGGSVTRKVTSFSTSMSHDVALLRVPNTDGIPGLLTAGIPDFGVHVHYVGYSANHLGVYEGIYSGIDPVERMHMYTGFTDGGASGSPLFDPDGHVIGVVVASYRGRPWSYFEPIQGLLDIIP